MPFGSQNSKTKCYATTTSCGRCIELAADTETTVGVYYVAGRGSSRGGCVARPGNQMLCLPIRVSPRNNGFADPGRCMRGLSVCSQGRTWYMARECVCVCVCGGGGGGSKKLDILRPVNQYGYIRVMGEGRGGGHEETGVEMCDTLVALKFLVLLFV